MELKLCPNCGTDTACEFKQKGNNHIYCCDCWCETAGCDTMEEAVELWNKGILNKTCN